MHHGGLSVVGDDHAGVIWAVRELQLGVLGQVVAGDRIADDVCRDHPFVERWVLPHVAGQDVRDEVRALRVSREDEGAPAVEVFEVVLERADRVGRRDSGL